MLKSFKKYCFFISVILLPHFTFAGNEDVSLLEKLPDEFILKLEQLKKEYYGDYPKNYGKTLKNIPPIPGKNIDIPLLRLAYHRYVSNKYLRSPEANDQQLCIATLRGHTDGVISVIALPDGRLVSGSDDRTLKVWDLNKQDGQECIATLEGHTRWVSSVIALPDGRLVSGSGDRTLKVWDLNKQDGPLLPPPPPH